MFSSCLPVRGINRSIICDLQRNSYTCVPNDLFDVVVNNDGKSLIEIKEFYQNQYNEIIEEYFIFLLKNEFVFYAKDSKLFPKMSLEWYEPFLINNALIDVDDKSKLVVKEVLFQLEKLKCKSIEFRFYNEITFEKIIEIIKTVENFKSIICSIGFVIRELKSSDTKVLKKMIFDYPRISYVLIYNSNENKYVEPIRNNTGFIIFSTQNIDSNLNCGIISNSNFVINTRLFTESQHHNTCLNRKISIDKEGFIRNCPSMPQHFGNIKDTTLEEALNHSDFKKYWNINKDMIAVCKDCEFRHICTDCRAYTERTHFEEDIDLSKPLKCGYNPYTNEWAEWSTNPLKEKAIEYYGMQDLVKKE